MSLTEEAPPARPRPGAGRALVRAGAGLLSLVPAASAQAAADESGALHRHADDGPAGLPTDEWVSDPSEQDDLFAIENLLYRQEDGGGNPFVDEDATIYESLVLVRKRLDERNVVGLRGLVDVISAASYDAVEELATEATGYSPGRLGGRIEWEYAHDGLTVQLDHAYDQELYYRSSAEGVRVAHLFAEGNTELGARFRRYRDHLRNVLFDGTVLPDESRDTRTAEVTWGQLVTPHSRVSLALTYTAQDGFLATSFNRVLVGGLPRREVLPNDRKRGSATVQYRHALFERDAGQVGYRYYEDDWEVRSHTVELRWFRPVGEGDVMLEPNLRWYDQSPSEYFAREFAASEPFMTSDPDLGRFHGHTLGLDVAFYGVEVFGEVWDLTAGFSYYDRSDGLDLYWLTLGGSFRF